MCMADTSTIPSRTPLFSTMAATWSVMRTNSWRALVLNQRYSVVVFMCAWGPASAGPGLPEGSPHIRQGQRRVGVDVPAAAPAGSKGAQAGGGDHRGIVGRKADVRHEHGHARGLAPRQGVAAQAAVGRDAAGNAHRARAARAGSVEQLVEQRFHDDTLKARAQIPNL